MLNDKLRQEVGRLLHAGIPRAVALDLPTPDVWRLAAELVAMLAGELSTPVAGRVREELATKIEVYMGRARPDPPWELVGVEESLRHSRLDMLWWHPRCGLVIDELKNGRVDRTSVEIAPQLSRLVGDGVARWGGQFAGVRVVPLRAVSQTWMAAPCSASSALRGEITVGPAVLPEGMQVR